MDENVSPTPQAPLQPQQGTSTTPALHPHKHFFIIGSLFTVLMLLVASGILYFQVYDNLTAQDSTQVAAGPILDSLGQPTGYEKDGQSVYYIDKTTKEKIVVVGADPKTFTVIYGNYGPAEAPLTTPGTYNWLFHTLGKDSRYIYSDSNIVAGGDAPTFVSIKEGEHFYKDKNAIYYFNPKSGLSILPDADSNTFEIRTDLPSDNGGGSITTLYFSSDETHMYFQSSLIVGADPKTFEIIKDGKGEPTQYEKDSSNIFFLGEKLKGVDYQTFAIPNPYPTGNGFYNAEDKNDKFLNGKRIIFDEDGKHAYKEIFLSVSKDFYCYMRVGTESNCSLFVKDFSNEEFVDLKIILDYGTYDSGGFLSSPGGKTIAIILEKQILRLDPETAEQKVILEAPTGKTFGTYSGFPSFLPKAKWVDATHLQYLLYPEGSLDDLDVSPSEIKTIEVK